MSVLRKTREHYKGLDWEEELKKQKELRRGIDDRMIAKIQQFRTDRLDKLMILITKSGNGGMIWLFVALYLYIVKNMHHQAMVLICVIAAVAFIANFIIKGLFTKDRPCDLDETVDLLIRRPLGSSLPSGHSAASFACVVVIFHMNPWWGAAALIWASLIAFSRIYLYVHFPSDVLFGVISGTIIGLIAMPVAIHFIGW